MQFENSINMRTNKNKNKTQIMKCPSERKTMIFLLFSIARCANVGTYSDFCCNYGDSISCTTGGCSMTQQSNELQFFYPVDDCAACVQNFGNQTTAITTNCEFCLPTGDDCSFATTNTGCEQPDSSHQLFDFEITSVVNGTSTSFADLATSELCCYWLTNTNGVYDVATSTGGCAKSAGHRIHNSRLVAFVEHFFDFDCPATPPCAGGCSGHGFCAVSECVCEKGWVGELCAERCDAKLCVNGRCHANVQTWPPTPRTTTTTTTPMIIITTTTVNTPFSTTLANNGSTAPTTTLTTTITPTTTPQPTAPPDPNNTISDGVCHCFSNFAGARCDACAPHWVGEQCEHFCPNAPCDGPHMNGTCTNARCDCVDGFAGLLCDRCDATHVGPNCNCTNADCGYPLHGKCSLADGTCECAFAWEGARCDQCTCSNHGNCTQSIGLCACDERYTGVRCDACKPPYYDYANGCKQVCLPDQCGHGGSCNNVTGLCDCPSFTIDANCTQCHEHMFGALCDVYCDPALNCSSAGTCNAFTGQCDCPVGFAGNCTTCAPNYYPIGSCTKRCDPVIDCNNHGHCDQAGLCVCASDIIYTSDNCDIRLYVIIVPCCIVVVGFGIFFGCVYWKKRKQHDEWGEPLLY